MTSARQEELERAREYMGHSQYHKVEKPCEDCLELAIVFQRVKEERDEKLMELLKDIDSHLRYPEKFPIVLNLITRIEDYRREMAKGAT